MTTRYPFVDVPVPPFNNGDGIDLREAEWRKLVKPYTPRAAITVLPPARWWRRRQLALQIAAAAFTVAVIWLGLIAMGVD